VNNNPSAIKVKRKKKEQKRETARRRVSVQYTLETAFFYAGMRTKLFIPVLFFFPLSLAD
jgi:hypothetical protein